MQRDYYEILGVTRDADADTIKKAYRKMAMKYHPDQNPDDKEAENKFKEAAQAYEVLRDADKRARYDRFGHAGVNGGGGFGGGAGGFHDVGDIFDAFGDIFGDFFGGGSRRGPRQRNRPRRGSDLRYYLEIDLEDVINGTKNEIDFDIEAPCDVCEGSGAKPGSGPEACGTCHGQGQVIRQQGFFQMATPCPTCAGSGEVIKDPCEKCKGQGRVPTHKKLRVNVPPGVDNGTQLRLSGEGEEGFRGGGAGDLYVEIRVRPHKTFRRQGDHLIARQEISYLQALLGSEIEVETLRGPQTLSIPRGTSTGDVLKIEDQGVPSIRSGRPGDLLFEVGVKMPKKLSKKEEKLLREIAEEKGEAVSPEKSGFFGLKS